MNNIKDIINSILNQDATITSDLLDTEMKSLIGVLTDIKKREVVQDIFGKKEKEVNQDGTRE